MNVYAVVSEELEYTEKILCDGSGPTYTYRIAEIVAAPTRSRARWLAWRGDKESFDPWHIDEMPKFSVNLIRKNEDWTEGIHSGLEYLWAWNIKRPWLLSEAMLVDNFLALWGEAETDDD